MTYESLPTLLSCGLVYPVLEVNAGIIKLLLEGSVVAEVTWQAEWEKASWWGFGKQSLYVGGDKLPGPSFGGGLRGIPLTYGLMNLLKCFDNPEDLPMLALTHERSELALHLMGAGGISLMEYICEAHCAR